MSRPWNCKNQYGTARISPESGRSNSSAGDGARVEKMCHGQHEHRTAPGKGRPDIELWCRDPGAG